MHLTVNKKELERALIIAAAVSAQKVINPALQGTLLTAQNNSLKLQSSDSEVFFFYNLECDIKSPGSVLVKTSLFRDIIKSCPSETIEINTENTSTMLIKAIGSRYEAKLNTLTQDEFPPIPNFSTENSVLEITGLELREMISKTIPFAAKDDVRFTFNSLYFEKEDIELRVISSDTKRLAFIKHFLAQSTNSFSFLISAKTALILKDMLNSSANVSITNTDNLVVFKYDNMILITNQINGSFPDYRTVIPKETPHILELKKDDISSLLKTFAPFYNGESQKLIFSLDPKKLLIETEETELGKAHNDMEVDYNGASVKVAFNYRFVSEIVTIIDDPTITIKIMAADKPVIFQGKGSQTNFYVCVPMKL